MGVWVEPVGIAAVETTKASDWHLSEHAADRESGRCGCLRVWLMIVFGPSDPTVLWKGDRAARLCRDAECSTTS